MSEFFVESGVEIPAVVRRGTSKYPFDTMKVGDSFHVPLLDGETSKKVAGRLRGAIAAYAKRGGAGEFTCRTMPDGIRVWRNG